MAKVTVGKGWGGTMIDEGGTEAMSLFEGSIVGPMVISIGTQNKVLQLKR